MVASGALAFDGKGWPWERPLVWTGLIKPELFTIVLKTLTLEPRRGNLRWWKPWDCVRLIPGGSVNKVGLTNPGIQHWNARVAPKIDYSRLNVVASIYGNQEELVDMTHMLNVLPLKAIELNPSCPNTGEGNKFRNTKNIIDAVHAVKRASRHPVLVKVSYDQDYVGIAQGTEGVAEAISINSVPWASVFPGSESPLWRLEKRVKGGGGGVSGIPAQPYNWEVIKRLAMHAHQPVIGCSIMRYEDIRKVKDLGAEAISFGAIHLRTPWAPTRFVERELALKR